MRGFLFFLAFASFFGFGLWGLYLDLVILNDFMGFWGIVLGLVLSPAVFVAAPWYAAIAMDWWLPLQVSYGGYLVGGVLLWLATSAFGEEE